MFNSLSLFLLLQTLSLRWEMEKWPYYAFAEYLCPIYFYKKNKTKEFHQSEYIIVVVCFILFTSLYMHTLFLPLFSFHLRRYFPSEQNPKPPPTPIKNAYSYYVNLIIKLQIDSLFFRPHPRIQIWK